MPSPALLLTDDEVVAIAVDALVAWPSALPTVDVEDAEQLTAAMQRGRRSLQIRGMATDDDDQTSSLNVARGLAGGAGHIHVYLGDDKLQRASWSFTTVLGQAGDLWCTDILTSDGTHRLVETSRDDALTYLTALLEGAFVAGPEGSPVGTGEPGWLCALAVMNDERLAVAIRRHEIVVQSSEAGGPRPSQEGAWTPQSVAEALVQTVTSP